MKRTYMPATVACVIALITVTSMPVLAGGKPEMGGLELLAEGLKKFSEKVEKSLKPEERKKERDRAYGREVSSYSAEKSAAERAKYWEEKRKKEDELLKNARKDHSAQDRKTHKRYKSLHEFLFGKPDDNITKF